MSNILTDAEKIALDNATHYFIMKRIDQANHLYEMKPNSSLEKQYRQTIEDLYSVRKKFGIID